MGISKGRNLGLTFALLFSLAAPAFASQESHCPSFFKRILQQALGHHDHQEIEFSFADGSTKKVRLGDGVERHYQTSVYRVEDLDPRSPELGGELLADIPNGREFPALPGKLAGDDRNEQIARVHEFLLAAQNKIEADPAFPKDPAWGKGKLPVLPVSAWAKTEEGTALLRPSITGRRLSDIAEVGALTPAMKQSLGELEKALEAVSKNVRTPRLRDDRSLLSPQPLRLNADPWNLVWVSEPSEMKKLGLKRPSFIVSDLVPLRKQQEAKAASSLRTHFDYWYNKAKELKELDASNITASKLRFAILATTKNRTVISVPVSELQMIHPITREAAEGKLLKRVSTVRDHAKEIGPNNLIDLDFQSQYLPSKNMIRVLKNRNGNFIIFDGNGRLEALNRAFPDDKVHSIEVELFESDSNYMLNLLDKVREERGYTNH